MLPLFFLREERGEVIANKEKLRMDTIEGNGQGIAKRFEQVPRIVLPANYATELPVFLAQMAVEHGPIFCHQVEQDSSSLLGEWLVYMVGPEANKFVLHSHRAYFSHDLAYTPLFALGGFRGRGMLNTDGSEHAYLRMLMNPAFANVSKEKYLTTMTRMLEVQVDKWGQQREVDIYQEAHETTLNLVSEILLGFRAEDRLHKLFAELSRMDDEVMQETYEQFVQRCARVKDEMNRFLLEVITHRRKAPTNDILGTLIEARDKEGKAFSDQELLEQVYSVLSAALETTPVLIAWLLYFLAQHQTYLARVYEELDEVLDRTDGEITLDALKEMRLLGYALSEAGRLCSPFGAVPRVALKDFSFGGYTIPAGTRVLLPLPASQRLPAIFREPSRFDPERFAPPREEDKRHPYALAIFGGGPRACIGVNFAQLEIKTLVAHILRKYELAPVEGQTIMYAYYKVTASLLGGIRLNVKPRYK